MKRIYLLLPALMMCMLVLGRSRKIIVAADGSGDYTTVQAAFDAIPLHNTEPVTIFVKKGVYREKLHLDSTKDFVTLEGEDEAATILTYDDHTGKVAPDGKVINTYTSASFFIRANDFTAKNITFQNNAGFTAGQAVAVEVEGDRCAFIHCRIVGFQDTLFTNSKNSREFYEDCYIEGTTDFIFGSATALFKNCELHSKKNSHVTAASTPEENPFGYLFVDCRLTADSGLRKVSLGRPWRPYASVTYIHCYIGSHILPAGWYNWNKPEREKTARYSEYNNYGPGADRSQRVAWSHELTKQQAKAFTEKNILRGWNPPRR